MSDWYPENHTYTGSSDGKPVLPHYETMPGFIRIYDTVVLHSGWSKERKGMWRKALLSAAERWQYPVVVVELTSPTAYRAEGITVRPFTPDPAYPKNSYGGFGLAPVDHPETSEYHKKSWDRGKGFALIYPSVVEQAFLGRNTTYLRATIAHEVGHALGFGHGGTGIMESVLNEPYFPNAEELAALKSYWG
jgi:hypothetical protein